MLKFCNTFRRIPTFNKICVQICILNYIESECWMLNAGWAEWLRQRVYYIFGFRNIWLEAFLRVRTWCSILPLFAQQSIQSLYIVVCVWISFGTAFLVQYCYDSPFLFSNQLSIIILLLTVNVAWNLLTSPMLIFPERTRDVENFMCHEAAIDSQLFDCRVCECVYFVIWFC